MQTNRLVYLWGIRVSAATVVCMLSCWPVDAGLFPWHPETNRWQNTWDRQTDPGFSRIHWDSLDTGAAALAILNSSLLPGEEPIRHFHVFAPHKDQHQRHREPVFPHNQEAHLLRAAAQTAKIFSAVPPDETGHRRIHVFRHDRHRKPRPPKRETRPPVVERPVYEVAKLNGAEGTFAGQSQAVPEPSTLLLFALAACGFRLVTRWSR